MCGTEIAILPLAQNFKEQKLWNKKKKKKKDELSREEMDFKLLQ